MITKRRILWGLIAFEVLAFASDVFMVVETVRALKKEDS